MFINCQQYSSDQLYHLLIQTVVPRPIAWVLSDNGNATFNLAPFSFFNAVSSNPPVVMISVGWKNDQTRKDTWVNIEKHNHFVIHLAPVEMADQMVQSSATLEHGVSEVDQLHLPLEKVDGFPLPRVIGPKVAFFCTKYAIYEIGGDPQGLILGEVKHIWMDEAVFHREKERIVVDYERLNPLSRLGGNHYALPGQKLTIKRPQ